MSAASYSRSYNNSSNPCFDGSCLVKTSDGGVKTVRDISKGDRVHGGGEVLCTIQTLCENDRCELVEMDGGLLITPYHPIRIDGVWTFPKDIKQAEERECAAVFSFVLSDGHVMEINGIECVTLGHNFKDNEVIAHPYFGSNKIVEDLKKFKVGWKRGLILMNYGAMQRGVHNDTDTMIMGFEKDRVSVECF